MVEIKICGVKDEAIAAVAIDNGVNYVGVVTGTPDSPRHLDVPSATGLIEFLRGKVTSVLVTRELTRDFIHITGIARPDIVQFCEPVSRPLLDDLRVVHRGRVIFSIPPLVDHHVLGTLTCKYHTGDLILVDGSQGRGIAIDEHALIMIVDRLKETLGLSLKDVLVAGGFSPSTVGPFLDRHAPRGVDASSGLESSPGMKDPNLIVNFCKGVKKARIVNE